MSARDFTVFGLVILVASVASSQEPYNTKPSTGKPTAASSLSGATEDESYIFRVTTREVVIEFVAMDKAGRLVRDLSAQELQVYEFRPPSEKVAQNLVAFTFVQAGSTKNGSEVPRSAMRLVLGGGCAVKIDAHYEAVYHPSSGVWRSGYHTVLLATNRQGVKLSYRPQYYVGEMAPIAKVKEKKKAQARKELEQAACYHPTVPSSILLSARQIQTGRADALRYSLLIAADSLSFISLSEEFRRVELDYGVCTFDAAGRAPQYMEAAAEQVLTPEEYQSSRRYGFPHLLEFPARKELGLARFVIRDRGTGNIGWVDVIVSSATGEAANEEQIASKAKNDLYGRTMGGQVLPVGPIGSFGSVVPSTVALCGDVYELNIVDSLPNFWTLSPIGAIYTHSLNVPDQLYGGAPGIPGVTRRTDWFGIDYHGTFWVKDAGEYEFRLESDDGARLFIDGQLIIDVDGIHPAMVREERIRLGQGQHTIHVPYFQGPLDAVALVLSVKPPGGTYKPFDVRDFAESN